MQFDEAIRNARGNAIEATVGTTAILRIYSEGSGDDAIPATVADANVGTLLAEFAMASDWISAFTGGVASLNDLPLETTGIADGTAYYFRIYSSDGTTARIQGTISDDIDSGADMIISNSNIAIDDPVNITQFDLTEGGE